MQDFRNLQVWKKSHEFTLKIYKLSQSFPKEETYGLTSQLRRASTSIPTNIAEGCVKNTNPEYSRFLYISLGSMAELETQLIIATNLKYISSSKYELIINDLTDIRKMLSGLIKYVKNR